jgi:hypothetical protein
VSKEQDGYLELKQTTSAQVANAITFAFSFAVELRTMILWLRKELIIVVLST